MRVHVEEESDVVVSTFQEVKRKTLNVDCRNGNAQSQLKNELITCEKK